MTNLLAMSGALGLNCSSNATYGQLAPAHTGVTCSSPIYLFGSVSSLIMSDATAQVMNIQCATRKSNITQETVYRMAQ